MNPTQLRVLSYVGIVLVLALSIWYLIRTYQEGNPRWYFLIMAMGIAILLSYNLIGTKKNQKPDPRKRR
jgi:hypothetical protein